MGPWWLTSSLASVPWKRLLARAPDIVDAARMILEIARSRSYQGQGAQSSDFTPIIHQMRQNLRALEEHAEANADLVQQVAGQLEGLTRALAVLNARVTLAVGIALVSLISSGILVAVTLLR